MHDYQTQFIRLALDYQALQFGQFTLKSGRVSPYFFNAGGFNDGYALQVLGHCYAACLNAHHIAFDLVFGPAYKGIPLAVTTAMALSNAHQPMAWCFDRKEAKAHGDQGQLVGTPLAGRRVVLVDDVMTAGTAMQQSLHLLAQHQAKPAAVVVALDRQERGQHSQQSAVQEIAQQHQIPVLSLINLATLERFLANHDIGGNRAAITAYRQRYGVADNPC